MLEARNIPSPDSPQAGARVFDVADPTLCGKVIAPGAEQSEIRFDDNAVRIVSNQHLKPVEPSIDGLTQVNPSAPPSVVQLGQQAMERKRRSLPDWWLIGGAIDYGRAEVLREINSNKPAGKRFQKAMGDWLIANGFKEIDKGVRSRLADCLKHKPEIEKWLATLTDSQRFELNHPNTVLRRWKASMVVTDPNAPPRISPAQKIKDELVAVIEERDRLKREIDKGNGDVWSPKDTAKNIAIVMLAKLSEWKAEQVAREILAGLKESASK